MGKRECRVCRKIKCLKMFYKNKASHFGRIRMCKKCCSISKRINGQKYRDTELFGGNREKAIKRDKYKCVCCGMARRHHKEKIGIDIIVDHKDGNGRRSMRQNNSMSNLQTLCASCHGKKEGGKSRCRFGERHPNSKLTDKDVIKIKELYHSGNYFLRELGETFGISRTCVGRIINKKAWKHIL